MDIQLTEGADYLLSMVLADDGKPLPLHDYLFEAQVRKDFDRLSPVIIEFEVSIPNPDNGEVWLSATKEGIAGISPPGKANQYRVPLGVFDIMMTTPAGSRSLLYQARARYHRTVTRSQS